MHTFSGSGQVLGAVVSSATTKILAAVCTCDSTWLSVHECFDIILSFKYFSSGHILLMLSTLDKKMTV